MLIMKYVGIFRKMTRNFWSNTQKERKRMRRKEKLEISFLQLILIVGTVAIGAFFYGHNCGMQQSEQKYQQEKAAGC